MVQSPTRPDGCRVPLQAIRWLNMIAMLVAFLTIDALTRAAFPLLDGVIMITTLKPFSASPLPSLSSCHRWPPRHRGNRHARSIPHPQRPHPPAHYDCRSIISVAGTSAAAFTTAFCMPVTTVATALLFLAKVATLVHVCLDTVRERSTCDVRPSQSPCRDVLLRSDEINVDRR